MRSQKGNAPEILQLQEALRRSAPESARLAVAPYQVSACKTANPAFIPHSAASFVITPLVPGSPSLDVKPHSPGGTRR